MTVPAAIGAQSRTLKSNSPKKPVVPQTRFMKPRTPQEMEAISDQIYEAAGKAFDAKDWPRAEALYMQALQLDPGDATARSNIATTYENRSREFLRKNDLAGYWNASYKGYLIEPAGRERIEGLTTIPGKDDPNKPAPPAENRERMGDYWFATGANLYALAEYEMLERLRPGDEQTLKKLLEAYKLAKAEFPNFVAFHEQSYPRLTSIVRVENAKGSRNEPKIDDKEVFWSNLDKRVTKNEYDKVIAELNKYLESNPSDLRALHRRANAYWHIGDLEKAEVDAKKLLEADQNSYDAYQLLAGIAQEKNQFDDAIAKATRAISINPDRDSAYRRRASAYNEAKKETESKADFEKFKEVRSRFGRYIPDGEPRIEVESLIYLVLNRPLLTLGISKQVGLQKAYIEKLPKDKKYVGIVHITFNRDGTLSDQKIEKSSTDEQVDQLFLTGLKSIQKVLPIPCGQSPTLEIGFPFVVDPNDLGVFRP